MNLGELDLVINGKLLYGQKNIGTRGEAEDKLPTPLSFHRMILIRRHCISFPCFGHLQILLIWLPLYGWLNHTRYIFMLQTDITLGLLKVLPRAEP